MPMSPRIVRAAARLNAMALISVILLPRFVFAAIKQPRFICQRALFYLSLT